MAPNVKGDVDVANVKGVVADGTELAAPNVNGVNGAMEGAELVVLDAPKLKLGVTGFDGAELDDPSNGAVADDEPKLPKALAAGEAPRKAAEAAGEAPRRAAGAAGEAPRKAAGAEVDTSLSGAVGADPLKSVAPGTAGKTVFASVAVPNVVLGTGASGAAGLEEERDGGVNEVWWEFDATSVCTRPHSNAQRYLHMPVNVETHRHKRARARHARTHTCAHSCSLILPHTHANPQLVDATHRRLLQRGADLLRMLGVFLQTRRPVGRCPLVIQHRSQRCHQIAIQPMERHVLRRRRGAASGNAILGDRRH